MARITGSYVVSTTLGEPVRAFVPDALPPANPVLLPACWQVLNDRAVLALQRLSAVAGLVPSVDWLLYSAIRKEALLTSQIEGTQVTLIDLFDKEAGLAVSNTDDACVGTIVTVKNAHHVARNIAIGTTSDLDREALLCGIDSL